MKAQVPDDSAQLDEERRLIERAHAGDREALRPLLVRLGPVLYSGVILPRLGNEADAEDVLRDTLMTALDRIDQFQWKGRSIYYWLRQIAVNKVIDVHRRRQRSDRLSQALRNEADAWQPEQVLADEALIAAEERQHNRERIARVLGALNPRYAEAIRLRLTEELPRRECAARMEVTLGTFDVLFFRAIRAFRKKFLEEDESRE